MYYLDERELLVKAMKRVPEEARFYRISEENTEVLEDAVVFPS